MKNHYGKFEYKGTKSVRVANYTKITQCKHPKGGVDAVMSKVSTPKTIILSIVRKMGAAHFQCVNNHYRKFEYKGIKKIFRQKDTIFFENFKLTPLVIYNGLSLVYCIKPERRIH